MADEPYAPSPIGNPSVLARRNWWQTKLIIFIGKHTPKCREMARILSRSMDEPMPLSMRIKKRMHYLICCWCQRYEQQLIYLRKTARVFAEHADEASNAPVTDEMKGRWKQILGPSASVVHDWSEKKVTLTGKLPRERTRWMPAVMVTAVLALLLVGFLFAWMNFMRPAASLADYRDEMISFAKIDPTLERQSAELTELTTWLETSHSMSGMAIPDKVRTMEPVGCRMLRFRKHDVGLICFRRANGKLLHLFVTDRAALPRLQGREEPQFSSQGGWMTAVWSDKRHAYLMAVEGDQATLEDLIKL